jgi:hypothetical protein
MTSKDALVAVQSEMKVLQYAVRALQASCRVEFPNAFGERRTKARQCMRVRQLVVAVATDGAPWLYRVA